MEVVAIAGLATVAAIKALAKVREMISIRKLVVTRAMAEVAKMRAMANETLRNNKQLLLIAISSNACALEYASDELK